MRCRGEIVEGPGGRQILVEDPAGNPVELLPPRSPLSTSLGGRGSAPGGNHPRPELSPVAAVWRRWKQCLGSSASGYMYAVLGPTHEQQRRDRHGATNAGRESQARIERDP
jgi:hypothetical protein